MKYEKRRESRDLVDGKRRFLGPLNPREEKLHEGFMGLEMNEYENMQKKHLKAYLRGDVYFFYKKNRYSVESNLEVNGN